MVGRRYYTTGCAESIDFELTLIAVQAETNSMTISLEKYLCVGDYDLLMSHSSVQTIYKWKYT